MTTSLTVFHNTTPDLQDQDQDHRVLDQDQDQDRMFWSETGLVLRPTVSDHITVSFSGAVHSPAATWSRVDTLCRDQQEQQQEQEKQQQQQKVAEAEAIMKVNTVNLINPCLMMMLTMY